MKKILVPTDFSDSAKPAIHFAANLVRKVSGEIYLLHVIESGDEYSDIPTSGEWHSYVNSVNAEIPYMIGVLKETKAVMEKIKAEPAFEMIKVKDVVEVGIACEEINHAAEKYDADMIIMGTHGAKGLKEVFIGSNAEKVVEDANRPVISIKENYTISPSNIIFASDFIEEADDVFDTVRDFASIYGARIHLLKVTTPEKFESLSQTRKRINGFRKYHNAEECEFTVYNDYRKEAGILHFANDIKADMIAIGTHGRHGLSRFFNASISEDLVNHSPCTVMTVNFRK